MPLSPALAVWLQERGHQAVHASQIGLHRATDETIIGRASESSQVIITADLDYPRLLALAPTNGPGIILYRAGDFSEQESLQGLERAFRAIPEDDFPRSIVVIERERIRRRRLPLSADD